MTASLVDVLAALEALARLHRSHHWSSVARYEEHLLFDRVYETAASDVDRVAEKLVAIAGIGSVEAVALSGNVSGFVRTYATLTEPSTEPGARSARQVSLDAELSFLETLDDALGNTSSAGVDNLLSELYDKHEGSVYLLSAVEDDEP